MRRVIPLHSGPYSFSFDDNPGGIPNGIGNAIAAYLQSVPRRAQIEMERQRYAMQQQRLDARDSRMDAEYRRQSSNDALRQQNESARLDEEARYHRSLEQHRQDESDPDSPLHQRQIDPYTYDVDTDEFGREHKHQRLKNTREIQDELHARRQLLGKADPAADPIAGHLGGGHAAPDPIAGHLQSAAEAQADAMSPKFIVHPPPVDTSRFGIPYPDDGDAQATAPAAAPTPAPAAGPDPRIQTALQGLHPSDLAAYQSVLASGDPRKIAVANQRLLAMPPAPTASPDNDMAVVGGP